MKQGRLYGSAAAPQATSPTASAAKKDRRPALVWISGLPLLLSAAYALITAKPLLMGVLIGAFIALYASTRILRAGINAAAAYAEREISAPPAWPRKLISALIVGAIIILVNGLSQSGNWLLASSYGLVATLAHILAFGIDPLRAKGLGNHPDAARVIRAVSKAEARIEQIHTHAQSLAKGPIRTRFAQICDKSRAVLRELEQNPSGLLAARKFLTVYLDGLQKISERSLQQPDNAALLTELDELLDAFERTATHQLQQLRARDQMDLDIEMEVLLERLEREPQPAHSSPQGNT